LIGNASNGGKNRDFRAASGGRPALRCACFRPELATEFSGTGYLLGLIHDHKTRKRLHALADLRRLKLISAGRLQNP
jgi:hypothetical protein